MSKLTDDMFLLFAHLVSELRMQFNIEKGAFVEKIDCPASKNLITLFKFCPSIILAFKVIQQRDISFASLPVFGLQSMKR